MSTTETRFHVSEKIVNEVYRYAQATPPDEFQAEEFLYMQDGMRNFEAAMCAATAGYAGEIGAARMRAGLLVTHRVLRYGNGDEPLPAAIDTVMNRFTITGSVRRLFTPEYLDKTGADVKEAYTGHPGVSLLLDSVLTKVPSRAGGVLLLGLHVPWVNPDSAISLTGVKDDGLAGEAQGRMQVRRRRQASPRSL